MNVDFFIHGTPQGQDVYSTCKNKDLYVLSFYGSKFESGSLVVETKVFDNKIYCYYTFYVNDINDSQKRNAYFAITLRCDQFVKCINTIYKLLELVYEQYVIGQFISLDNSRRFLVNSFDVKCNDVFNKLSQLLTTTLKDSDLIKLDESFITNTNPPLLVHPSSINKKEIVSTYKKLERLVLSPFATSAVDNKRIEEFQNKIDYIKHEYEEKNKNHVAELKSTIEKLKKEINYLNEGNRKLKETLSQKVKVDDEIRSLKLRNDELSSENHHLQRKMSAFGHDRLQFEKENEVLKSTISRLSVIFDEYKSGHRNDKEDSSRSLRKNNLFWIVIGTFSNTVCLVILLIVVLLGMYIKSETDSSVQPSSIENLTYHENGDTTLIPKNVINTEQSIRDIQKGVRIDIPECRGILYRGEKYHLKLKGFEMPHEVSWNVLGDCDFDGNDAFTVIGLQPVEIQCLWDGKIIAERTINVEEGEVVM